MPWLFLVGCPKKTVVKEQPSVQKSEEARRLEAEREAKERELARIKEEEAKRHEGESLRRVWLLRKNLALKERFSKANCSKTSTSTLINLTSVQGMQSF